MTRFASLKVELVDRTHYRTLADARTAIFAWIGVRESGDVLGEADLPDRTAPTARSRVVALSTRCRAFSTVHRF